MDPIRVFVGVHSAPTVEERAELAVRELARLGAFERVAHRGRSAPPCAAT